MAKLSGANRVVSKRDVSKWIVALGADDQTIVSKASEQLIAWGPAVCDQLSDAIGSGTLTENKRDRVAGIRRAIFRRYRRASALIADLDSPAANKALSELLMKTRSTELKAIVKEAQQRRERYQGR